MNRFLLLILVLTLTPVMATAASFDCRKAATNVEKLVCSDKVLSALDDELAVVYRLLRVELNVDKLKVLAQTQKAWLAGRNTCATSACLRFAYDQRVEELREIQLMGPNPYALDLPAVDDDGQDEMNTMSLRCDYADHGETQYENVEIRMSVGTGDAAGIRKFAKDGKSASKLFNVESGKVAECVYPSGTRVRVKVGEDLVNPYGQCGADPMYFVSIWVNGRKIISRLWFAGHCLEESDAYRHVSYRIRGEAPVTVTKCETERSRRGGAPADGSKPRQQGNVPMCSDFPNVVKLPVDEVEYPPQGSKPPQVGSIERMTGNTPVCAAALQELAADFYTFFQYPQKKATLLRPQWRGSDIGLPQELGGSSESVFDFDNDGYLDRVTSKEFDTTYMSGSTLLVQPGSSARELKVSGNPLDPSSLFLPCQMDVKRPEIAQCPPFSQNYDEAGYEVPSARSGDSVHFRGRYTSLAPFTFERTTYIGLSSNSLDSRDYVAVVKPLPGRKFQPVCLFRRVPENF